MLLLLLLNLGTAAPPAVVGVSSGALMVPADNTAMVVRAELPGATVTSPGALMVSAESTTMYVMAEVR